MIISHGSGCLDILIAAMRPQNPARKIDGGPADSRDDLRAARKMARPTHPPNPKFVKVPTSASSVQVSSDSSSTLKCAYRSPHRK